MFIVYNNFRTILRYNNSSAYALGVSHLADRIRGGEPFVVAWPREEQPLARQDRVDLQELLTQAGYDTGGADGIIGPNSRAALRAYQRAIGETPDGFPTQRHLALLRELAGE